MMRRLLRIGVWCLGLAGVLIVLLLSPVAYVETVCMPRWQPPADTKTIVAREDWRSEARTLMTYPEWHIVHAYDDYAAVISRSDPHDFSYIRSVAGFWSSLCPLAEASADLGGVDTETRQMIYVIGVSFTAELALKAAYEETVGRVFTWFRGEQRAPLDDLSAQQAANYAKFLQQQPWYKWDFLSDVEALHLTSSGSLRDVERETALGLEFAAKAAYAGVIAAAVESTGQDKLTLRMVVSGLSTAQLESLEGVKVMVVHPQGIEIETPRYRALTHLLERMANEGGNFVEIAGNDDILFTALSGNSAADGTLYSFRRQGYGDYRHLIFVKVGALADRLRSLSTEGLTLEHIHDY